MMRLVKFLLSVIFVIVLFSTITASQKPSAPPPQKATEETAEEKARKIKWTRDVLIIRALRDSMKNPDSFRLEDATRMKDDVLCLEYRAANSFNAIIPGRAVITKTKIVTSDDRSSLPSFWNKHCAGKVGEDITYIRRAI